VVVSEEKEAVMVAVDVVVVSVMAMGAVVGHLRCQLARFVIKLVTTPGGVVNIWIENSSWKKSRPTMPLAHVAYFMVWIQIGVPTLEQ
jgi:hypothetical protein